MIRIDDQPDKIVFLTDIHSTSPVCIKFTQDHKAYIEETHSCSRHGVSAEKVIMVMKELWTEVEKVYQEYNF
jgi:hypothetical protein